SGVEVRSVVADRRIAVIRYDGIVAVVPACHEYADQRTVVAWHDIRILVTRALRDRTHKAEVAHLRGERRHAQRASGFDQEFASVLFHSFHLCTWNCEDVAIK